MLKGRVFGLLFHVIETLEKQKESWRLQE